MELSGPRHPSQEGPLGVVQEGAYAYLILVDGDPLEDLELVGDPGQRFVVIMKGGVIYKNTLNSSPVPPLRRRSSACSRRTSPILG